MRTINELPKRSGTARIAISGQVDVALVDRTLDITRSVQDAATRMRDGGFSKPSKAELRRILETVEQR